MVIGVDAADALLIEKWMGMGRLPTFARLASKGVSVSLDNSLRTLPGAIWPELATGRSCGRVPLYFHPGQIRTGEATPRPIEPGEVNPEDYFWVKACRAGRRVAVIDMPQTVLVRGLTGFLQVTEWGLHDRCFEIASEPRGLLEELRARHGSHPVESCDSHGACATGYQRLLDGLVEGARRKTDLLLDILARERWDLFACCFGESHCVGHQFWHFLDPSHPRHEANAPFHDAIQTLYSLIDAGIARLLEAAGPDARVLVVTSHGMGPYTGGPNLLPEVLRRMCLAAPTNASAGRAAGWLYRTLPEGLKRTLKRHLGKAVAEKARDLAGYRPFGLELPGTRAVALNNNRCGAIRLNLKGREPHGRVESGPEAQMLLARIRAKLQGLRDPTSGQPIVVSVATADEAFGPDHDPDIPDLIVEFRTDLGILDACISDSLGRIESPLYNPAMPRTGDHTPSSRLWALGPDITTSADLCQANVLDLAPTVLDLLGVAPSGPCDGRPLPLRAGGVIAPSVA